MTTDGAPATRTPDDGDDIAVRLGVIGDVPGLLEIYNHYVRTTAVTFDTVPLQLEERLEWFGHYGVTGPHRLFVAARADGALLGYAAASRLRPKPAYDTSVETSAYVRPDALGRGIGTLLYSHLFDALAGEDVHRAYAGIALPNPASVALHRRFGFREIGVYREVGRKFGRWWDVAWFERKVPG
jgi:phosphinothricin acetyltransferase